MENEPTKRPSWRRRKYLISPEFQITVMGYFIGLALVTIVVFYWSMRLIFGNLVEQAREIGLPPSHLLFQLLAEQRHTMNMVFLSTSLLLSVFLIVGGLILSHEIAGPIYRLNRNLRQIVEEDKIEDLQFRKKDFFQELVPDYNRLLEKLRSLRG